MVDGYKPTLAIVFMSIKQDIKAICDILDKQDISIFGATSCGEFIDGEISYGGIVILLLDMKKPDFKILIESYEGRKEVEVTKAMGLSALESFKNPLFLISNSFVVAKMMDMESSFNGLESAAGCRALVEVASVDRIDVEDRLLCRYRLCAGHRKSHDRR